MAPQEEASEDENKTISFTQNGLAMSFMEIGKLIIATRESYMALQPNGWTDLIALASLKMGSVPSPHPPADRVVYLGAHVAIEEEKILDTPLWASPESGFALSLKYGVVMRKACDNFDAQQYKALLELLTHMRLPVPSADAVLAAASKLNVSLTVPEDALREHTIQRRPYFGARTPSKWPTPEA